MAGLRFYVLCCRNIKALKRHQRTIPLDQMTVVINTLDESFESEASQFCANEGIDYVITESNGTPSQGKNSVMDLFQGSDYDYFVLVDGDDFLTPHGVWTYQQIAASDNPPDVLALEYQYGIWRDYGYGGDLPGNGEPGAPPEPTLGVKYTDDPDTILGYGCRCFMHPRQWWEDALEGVLVAKNETDHSYTLSSVHSRWVNHCYRFISSYETHLRLVFFSQSAAEGYRYDTEFMCGEDTLLYLTYKDAWVNGNLQLRHLFDRYPTYVYDQRVYGIIDQSRDHDEDGNYVGQDYGWYLWMKKLCEKYDDLEAAGQMHETQVPRLNVRTYVWPNPDPDAPAEDMSQYDIIWPDDYRPDLLGLVNYPGKQTVLL